jgi:hypothetical protein
MKMSGWPKDNQVSRNAFYGDPGKNEIGPQMVPVVPPFKMYYTDDNGKVSIVKKIMFHKKCAPALLAALNEIWDYCGHDQARVDKSGASKYFGAYNHRLVRGSKTKWSNHAYAAAIDLNAGQNALGVKVGTMPPFIVDAFARQGAMWGGWYDHRPDWMHFEFVDNGGRSAKTAKPVWPSKVQGIMSTVDDDDLQRHDPPNTPDNVPTDELEDHDGPGPGDSTDDDATNSPDASVALPPAPPVAPSAVVTEIAGEKVVGDPDTFTIQALLKKMNYSPGLLDGQWGGATGGAILGLINDRGLSITPPASFEEFEALKPQIKLAVRKADGEDWKRPVSPERKAVDTAVVEKVAPEIKPINQSYFATKWAAIVSFFVGLWTMLEDSAMKAWNFFFDHKDVIQDHPGVVKTAWSYVLLVPTSVWILTGAVGLALLAFNVGRAGNKINASVQTGARQ